MKLRKTITCLLCACVFALSLALCACGPSYNEEDVRDTFLGTWALDSCVEGGAKVSEDDIAAMKNYKLETTATFAEDGSFSMDMYGDALSGSYAVTNDNEVTVTISGYVDMIGSIEEGVLTLDDGNSQLLLSKKV